MKIQKINDYSFRIPREGKMLVDGVVFADETLMSSVREDKSLEQVANVACLPGIVGHSLAMPDIHWGYGFPIGGVAGFDLDEGVISPGGVGYDINCGVRLLATKIPLESVRERVPDLVQRLFQNIPSGVGRARKDLQLDRKEARRMATQGASWAVSRGFGGREDLDYIEEGGCLGGADFDRVSERAYRRGRSQLGTIGSGNHFVEVGYVEEIYESALASRLGLGPGQVTVIVHTGSRGFGYQICEDNLRTMQRAADRYGIYLPDRQLCCAPFTSDEGRAYLEAMKCGANFAFANRQLITHWVRESIEDAWGMTPREHGTRVIYDVCHNIAKVEEHIIDGESRRLCVHRKGATRAFPAGHPEVPSAYRAVGQPVLVPGDMGRYSYVLVGNPAAPDFTFASSCHGAGRVLSRKASRRATRERNIIRELADQGITVAAASRATVDEEFPHAYKDVADVVDVVHNAQLAIKVVRLRPVGVLKGVKRTNQERMVEILGAPVDYGANRRGVGMGPMAFRLAGLGDKLSREGIEFVDRGDVTALPTRVSESPALTRAHVKKVCQRLSEEVYRVLRRRRRPVVLGGDHSIAIGTLAGAARHFRERTKRLGVLWVDAHGDMNNPETSPSSNIHGMPLAVSLGDGYRDLVRLGGFSPKVESSSTALVGIRNLDAAEKANMERFGVRVFTMKEIDRKGLANVMDEALHVVSQGTAGVHMSFDMDAVDPQVAPGVGTAVPGGLSYREAHLIMELVHDAGVMSSLDIVETNPFLDVQNSTARLGVELVLSALGKSIY